MDRINAAEQAAQLVLKPVPGREPLSRSHGCFGGSAHSSTPAFRVDHKIRVSNNMACNSSVPGMASSSAGPSTTEVSVMAAIGKKAHLTQQFHGFHHGKGVHFLSLMHVHGNTPFREQHQCFDGFILPTENGTFRCLNASGLSSC